MSIRDSRLKDYVNRVLVLKLRELRLFKAHFIY